MWCPDTSRTFVSREAQGGIRTTCNEVPAQAIFVFVTARCWQSKLSFNVCSLTRCHDPCALNLSSRLAGSLVRGRCSPCILRSTLPCVNGSLRHYTWKKFCMSQWNAYHGRLGSHAVRGGCFDSCKHHSGLLRHAAHYFFFLILLVNSTSVTRWATDALSPLLQLLHTHILRFPGKVEAVFFFFTGHQESKNGAAACNKKKRVRRWHCLFVHLSVAFSASHCLLLWSSVCS